MLAEERIAALKSPSKGLMLSCMLRFSGRLLLYKLRGLAPHFLIEIMNGSKEGATPRFRLRGDQ